MALRTDYKDALYDGARKYRITQNADGTSGIADATSYTQEGDQFGANDINATNAAVNGLTDVELPELKKSVSDGKKLVAAAITAKRVTTAATATFAAMAANIGKIVLGSGNAGRTDVLAGKTFTNDDGVEYTGTMADKSGTSQSASASLDAANSRVQMAVPATGKYSTTSKLYATYASIRTLIGLTTAKLWPGTEILGLPSTREFFAGGTYTPGKSDKKLPCKDKAMSGDIVVKGDAGLSPENIISGKSIFGVAGSREYCDVAADIIYSGNVAYTSYKPEGIKDSYKGRGISCGRPYPDADSVILRICQDTTDTGAEADIVLRKGNYRKAAVVTAKYIGSAYQANWAEFWREADGEVWFLPIRGNASGTYHTVVEVLGTSSAAIARNNDWG